MSKGNVVRQRLADRDPVEFWLGRKAERSRASHKSVFKDWLIWLQQRPSWAGVDAKALLIRQAEAEDEYVLVELLQEYLKQRPDLRLNSKKFVDMVVRSFFLHNRVPLPKDKTYRFDAVKPPIQPKLSLDTIQVMVRNADLRDKSIILVKWQALLDNERLVWVGEHLAEQIVTQMRRNIQLEQAQNPIQPIRIDIPSRKQNEKPFYTFFSKDAQDALREYFDKERGWPKPNEPVWVKKTWRSGNVTAVTFAGFNKLWMRVLKRSGIVVKEKDGNSSTRYGFNPHEMRDIAKSLLHTQAKKDGLDMDCVEYWLGHTVDPLGYDKFFNDFEYVRKQYLIAEPYLNIISNTLVDELHKREQRERIEWMEKELLAIKQTLQDVLKQHS